MADLFGINPDDVQRQFLASGESQVDPAKIFDMLKRADPNASDDQVRQYMQEKLPEGYQFSGMDALGSFVKHIPGMAAQGIQDTTGLIEGLGKGIGAGLTTLGDGGTMAEAGAATAGAFGAPRAGEDFLKENVTEPLTSVDPARPTSLPGKIAWGLGEGVAETAPELIASMATMNGLGVTEAMGKIGAKVTAGLAKRGAIEGASSAWKWSAKIGTEIVKHAPVDAMYGTLVAGKGPMYQGYAAAYADATAQGNTAVADDMAAKMFETAAHEAATNALAGAILTPAFSLVGQGIKTALMPVFNSIKESAIGRKVGEAITVIKGGGPLLDMQRKKLQDAEAQLFAMQRDPSVTPEQLAPFQMAYDRIKENTYAAESDVLHSQFVDNLENIQKYLGVASDSNSDLLQAADHLLGIKSGFGDRLPFLRERLALAQDPTLKAGLEAAITKFEAVNEAWENIALNKKLGRWMKILEDPTEGSFKDQLAVKVLQAARENPMGSEQLQALGPLQLRASSESFIYSINHATILEESNFGSQQRDFNIRKGNAELRKNSTDFESFWKSFTDADLPAYRSDLFNLTQKNFMSDGWYDKVLAGEMTYEEAAKQAAKAVWDRDGGVMVRHLAEGPHISTTPVTWYAGWGSNPNPWRGVNFDSKTTVDLLKSQPGIWHSKDAALAFLDRAHAKMKADVLSAAGTDASGNPRTMVQIMQADGLPVGEKPVAALMKEIDDQVAVAKVLISALSDDIKNAPLVIPAVFGRGADSDFMSGVALGLYHGGRTMIQTTGREVGLSNRMAGTMVHEIGHFMEMFLAPEVKQAWFEALNKDPNGVMKELLPLTRENSDWHKHMSEIWAVTYDRFITQSYRDGMNVLGLPKDAAQILYKVFAHVESEKGKLPPAFQRMMMETLDGLYSKVRFAELMASPETKLARQEVFGKITQLHMSRNQAIVEQAHGHLATALVQALTQDHAIGKDVKALVKDADGGWRISTSLKEMSALPPEDVVKLGAEPDVAGLTKVLQEQIAKLKLPAQARSYPDLLMDTRVEQMKLMSFLSDLAGPDGAVTHAGQAIRDRLYRGSEQAFDDVVKNASEGVLHLQKMQKAQSASDVAAVYAELERTYKDLKAVNNQIYQANPAFYLSRDPAMLRGGMERVMDGVYHLFPTLKIKAEASVDMSKAMRTFKSAQWLGKKYPAVARAYEAFTSFVQRSQETQTLLMQRPEMLRGFVMPEKNGIRGVAMDAIRDASPEARLAMREMLVEGNRWANLQRKAEVETLEHGFSRDKQGNLDLAYFQTLPGLKDTSISALKEAYSLYLGTNATMNWIAQDVSKLLGLKRLLSESELAQMRNTIHIKRGYVPQSRFGQYGFSVAGEDGKTIYYRMADSVKALEAERQAIMKAGILPDGRAISPSAVKSIHKKTQLPTETMFGASPENVESMLQKMRSMMEGGDNEISTEQYKEMMNVLSEELRSGSFLSHTRKREDIAGWKPEELERGLVDYVAGYSKYRHRLDYMHDLLASRQMISQRQPEALKWMVKFADDTIRGQENYKLLSAIRNVTVARYIGFNLSTALMQVTQIPLTTLPRLIMENVKRPVRKISKALYDVRTGNLSDLEKRLLQEAEASGITWATYTQQLSAEFKGTIGKLSNRLMDMSSFLMQKAETQNRQVSLLAAFREFYPQELENAKYFVDQKLLASGEERAFREAYHRAQRVVSDTQYDFNKGNLPEFSRGNRSFNQISRQAYLLKQFSHSYYQMMRWMVESGGPGAKAAGASLGVLAALGGLGGMPGMGYLNMLMEKLSGKPLEQHVWDMMNDPNGQHYRWLTRGVASLTPTNIATRMNPDLQDMSPAALGVFEDLGKMTDAAQTHDWGRLVMSVPVVPRALGKVPETWGVPGVMRGKAQEGSRTTAGRLIPGTKLTLAEALASTIGFNPMNDGMVRYSRFKEREAKINDMKHEFASMVRNKLNNGERLSGGDIDRFMDIKRMSLMNGCGRWVDSPMEFKDLQDKTKF